MTGWWPWRASTRTALLAGVIIASSGRPNPISRMIPASCAGVRVVPLVNTTNGRPRAAAQLVISTAPGSGRSPWLRRSPSTSVPSRSNTNPRASRSRAADHGHPRPAPLSSSRNPGLSTTSRAAGGRDPSSRSSRSTGCSSGW